MSESPKKPGWAFWATVVLSLPVLYVASFGPACWLSNAGIIPSTAITSTYPAPLRVAMKGPQPYRRWFRWYVNLPESRSRDVGIKRELDGWNDF
jgi:hypothetical protein